MNELRLLLAEILLGWCLRLAPDNKDGERLVRVIRYYFSVMEKEIEPVKQQG